MSTLIGAVGESGRGKSTAAEGLDPEETFIINVTGKPLPFRGWKSKYKEFSKEEGSSEDNGGNYYATSDVKKIKGLLKHIDNNRPDVQTVLIDDCQYIMSNEFMSRIDEKGWDKFNQIAKNMFTLVNTARKLRNDLFVIMTFHEELISQNYEDKRKIKTLGKAIDNNYTLEGVFTIILFADVDHNEDAGENEYYFETQTDGVTTAKTPKEMFGKFKIPNDYQLVIDTIKEYEQG